MNRVHWLLPFIAPAVVSWQESGENPVLFCYLISRGTYTNLRSRASAPNPTTVRHEGSCSNTYGTGSTSFST
jgi:hypothetical protein